MADTVVGQKHALRYGDGGERLEVWFDATARYFSDHLQIRTNGSDDSTVYIDYGDVPWLAATLAELTDVLRAGGYLRDSDTRAKPGDKGTPGSTSGE